MKKYTLFIIILISSFSLFSQYDLKVRKVELDTLRGRQNKRFTVKDTIIWSNNGSKQWKAPDVWMADLDTLQSHYSDSLSNIYDSIAKINDSINKFSDTIISHSNQIGNINDTLNVFRDSLDNYHSTISTLQKKTDTLIYDATKYDLLNLASRIQDSLNTKLYKNDSTIYLTPYDASQTYLNKNINVRDSLYFRLKNGGGTTSGWKKNDTVTIDTSHSSPSAFVTNNYMTTTIVNSQQFKWVVKGGGTNKIYDAVQLAAAGDVIFVDAGAYTENNNIAKAGVFIFATSPNAVITKTTAGALFDISAINTNYKILGYGTYNCTYGFVKKSATGANTATYTEINFNSATSSGADAIYIEGLYNKGITINCLDFCKSTFRYALGIYTYEWDAPLEFIRINGGNYSSTANDNGMYFCIKTTASGSYLSMSNCSITTSSVTQLALALGLYKFAGRYECNIVNCNVTATKALDVRTFANYSGMDFNYTGSIVGSVYTSITLDGNYTYNGSIANGTFTMWYGAGTTNVIPYSNVTVNSSLVNVPINYGASPDPYQTMNATFNGTMYNISVADLNLNHRYHFNIVFNGVIYADNPIIVGTLSSGDYLYFNSKIFKGNVSNKFFTQNGGNIFLRGDVYSNGTNSSSDITLTTGNLEFGNMNYIVKAGNATSSGGICIANGGTIILAGATFDILNTDATADCFQITGTTDVIIKGLSTLKTINGYSFDMATTKLCNLYNKAPIWSNVLYREADGVGANYIEKITKGSGYNYDIIIK